MPTNPGDLRDTSGDDVRRAYSDIRRLWLFSIVPLVATFVTFAALLGSNFVEISNQYILVFYEATRLLVPLQVAALVAPWNIGHIMKLCSYWVGYRAILSVVALFHVLFAGLVTLLAVLVSMETLDITTPVQVPTRHFGRVLPASCLNTKRMSEGRFYSCGLEPVTGGFILVNSTEGIRTVNNVSDFNQVLYESENQIALLAPKDISRDLDYSAKTLGVSTRCQPKGEQCRQRLRSNSDSVVVHSCSADSGTVNATLTPAKAYSGTIELGQGNTPNPFNFWIWGIVDGTKTRLSSDPDVVKMISKGAISVLLDCHINVYNVTYSVQNGTVVPRTLIKTMANDAPSYVVADPLAINFPQTQLYERLRLASVTSNSASELASTMSIIVGEMALAYLAGVFEHVQNDEESIRKAVQYARLPLALVCLIVILGVSLFLQATCACVMAIFLIRKYPNAVVERDRLTLEARVSGVAGRDPMFSPEDFLR